MAEDPTRIKRVRKGPRRPDEDPCVEVIAGPSKGQRWWLSSDPVVLGRTELGDDGVSRKHAKVMVGDEGIITIKDLGSTNGTFVNGAPIDATVLREGDRIQLGPDVTLSLRFRVPGQAEPEDVEPQFVVSAREMEVATLVRDGLTNPQIGKRLHISRHTVVSHLSKIYERTGVSTRAALATLVAEGRVKGRG